MLIGIVKKKNARDHDLQNYSFFLLITFPEIIYMVIWFSPLELKLGCEELLLPRSFKRKNVAPPLHRGGEHLRLWLPCRIEPFELNWLCWTRLSRDVHISHVGIIRNRSTE